jgi:hypothetical protein
LKSSKNSRAKRLRSRGTFTFREQKPIEEQEKDVGGPTQKYKGIRI